MSEMTILPLEFHQATYSLIQNLLASKAFLTYHQSLAGMKADQTANELLERLSAFQNKVRQKQAQNSLTQEDIEALRNIQTQVQENTTIMQYAQSQQDAIYFLREINQEISQLIGMDLAGLAKKRTC